MRKLKYDTVVVNKTYEYACQNNHEFDDLVEDVANAWNQAIYAQNRQVELTLAGWTKIHLNKTFTKRTEEWCNANLDGRYEYLDSFLYVERPADAAWFMLRWS